jgi:hypothetical protein
MEDILIMSARRAYEYAQDEIRLTLLSNQAVIQHIQQAFVFQNAGVGQPMEMFGPVSPTIPPGLVFDYGIVPFPEGEATAIRFIHVEPVRIVIDVAGPSNAIDAAFETFMGTIDGIRTSDGAPAVPDKPRQVRDYSDIRFRAQYSPMALMVRGIYDAVSTSLSSSLAGNRDLVPVLEFRLAERGKRYLGSGIPQYDTVAIDLRAGTLPEERIFYSGAPLNSDEHLELLSRIESMLPPDDREFAIKTSS